MLKNGLPLITFVIQNVLRHSFMSFPRVEPYFSSKLNQPKCTKFGRISIKGKVYRLRNTI